MAGNLFEWCQDWFAEGYYATSPDADPPGPDGGDYRVLRGGSSAFNPHYLLRSAYRGRCDPDDSGVFAGIRGAVTP